MKTNEAKSALKAYEKSTTGQVKVRACSIRCIAHPEWGNFGVYEDRGDYYEINGAAGGRTLSKTEANRFWELAE